MHPLHCLLLPLGNMHYSVPAAAETAKACVVLCVQGRMRVSISANGFVRVCELCRVILWQSR